MEEAFAREFDPFLFSQDQERSDIATVSVNVGAFLLKNEPEDDVVIVNPEIIEILDLDDDDSEKSDEGSKLGTVADGTELLTVLASEPVPLGKLKRKSTRKMVNEAILNLNKMSGSSIIAIEKQILLKYDILDSKRLHKQVKKYITTSVSEGKLEQNKRSYRLPNQFKVKIKLNTIKRKSLANAKAVQSPKPTMGRRRISLPNIPKKTSTNSEDTVITVSQVKKNRKSLKENNMPVADSLEMQNSHDNIGVQHALPSKTRKSTSADNKKTTTVAKTRKSNAKKAPTTNKRSTNSLSVDAATDVGTDIKNEESKSADKSKIATSRKTKKNTTSTQVQDAKSRKSKKNTSTTEAQVATTRKSGKKVSIDETEVVTSTKSKESKAQVATASKSKKATTDAKAQVAIVSQIEKSNSANKAQVATVSQTMKSTSANKAQVATVSQTEKSISWNEAQVATVSQTEKSISANKVQAAAITETQQSTSADFDETVISTANQTTTDISEYSSSQSLFDEDETQADILMSTEKSLKWDNAEELALTKSSGSIEYIGAQVAHILKSSLHIDDDDALNALAF
ncbi:probable GPI-anchored adhesin-like protein PGA55 [Teleopsis dalmanni]|uniref:probable GPI-anchored adhesin-like protein PGA55 n=1 Tax=Teleopsis dalmanni TaxID=139649 RepID=UPI0018CFCCAB|nr:probable GPI-anchored adhesin-like protein PGA55 [Teleopsis dalmanni]